MRLAAPSPRKDWLNASITCEACGWLNLLPADPSHMIIMGRPWHMRLTCSRCGVTALYGPEKVVRAAVKPPEG